MQTRMFCGIVGLVLLGAFGGAALADPPTTWQVTYGIHATPADPSSPIAFRVTLALGRAAYSGNSIGWHVDSITIQRDATGDAWTLANAPVATSDGLWWICHADANNPQMAEFVRPPRLTGTATAQNPNTANLQYVVEGQVYSQPVPPNVPPYNITAALDYNFTLVGEQKSIGEGVGDPTEVDPPTHT